MLLLTRNVGQSIVINGNIHIHFLDVNGRQTRVGISAPLDITIHRKEIQDAIDAGEIRDK